MSQRENHFHAVADALTADGVPAYVEHMGGNILCVIVPAGENQWVIGIANETWGGDLCGPDGNLVGEGTPEGSKHLETSVSSESDDSRIIAASLVVAVNVVTNEEARGK